MNIRMATVEDAPALLDIYRPYVTETAISFEYEVPSVEEFRTRIINTLSRYPYIVAEENGQLTGYAYASPFKQRAAYDWSVETSIYVSMKHRGQGIGVLLYAELERILKLQNILNVNACIAYTDKEDNHLTNKSMGFHEHLGYRLVGRFTQSGYKFNTWYDMIWMEKIIGEHTSVPKSVIPVEQID